MVHSKTGWSRVGRLYMVTGTAPDTNITRTTGEIPEEFKESIHKYPRFASNVFRLCKWLAWNQRSMCSTPNPWQHDASLLLPQMGKHEIHSLDHVY